MMDMAMPEKPDEDFALVPDRGIPLVATWPRWAGFTIGAGALFSLLAYAYVTVTHSPKPLSAFLVPLLVATGLVAILVFVLLRSEESRLQRELRTARTGTAVIRNLILSRRTKPPFVLRLLTTTLGNAAVWLAEGERGAALDALGANSPLMQVGRLRMLRELVDCDVERATGNSMTLERCLQTLRNLPRIGNREADRYRTHVLTKAILEQANGDAAEDVLPELDASKDDEERLYAVWLRVWFDMDSAERPISDGELRLSLLLAKSHGAEELVKKLEQRLDAGGASG